MPARFQNTIGLLLLACGAIFSATQARSPVDAPSTAATTEGAKMVAAPFFPWPAKTKPQDIPYLKPLCSYLEITTQGLTEDKTLAKLKSQIEKLESERSPTETEPAAKFLIVTLPHPQLAGSDFLTDAMLETLRRAIEAPRNLTKEEECQEQLEDEEEKKESNQKADSDQKKNKVRELTSLVGRGPILDRYWLPWKDSDPVYWEDFGSGQPGMLVFRQLSRGKRQRFVVALVVGEHPALGIDRGAMEKSLHIIHKLQHVKDSQIRILGPTFTGSENSLARSLSEFQCKNPSKSYSIRLVNGSATALILERLKDAANPAKVDYSTTVIPDEVLQDHLLFFLAREPRSRALSRLRSLALLVESDTGFGQKNAALLNRLRCHAGLDFTVIPFPQHVSSVLGAYQARRQKAVEGLPELQSSEIEMGIPFETRDMRNRRLQPYEPELTAVRVDLLLREITRSLRERRTRYVGIIATRSLDKLFLAALVRQTCPDARLFTTVGDVLLTHPDVSADLSGMVVASTYPLYRANQDWSGPMPASLRAAFGHQSELGLYNAVQVLLETSDGMMEYKSPFHPSADYQQAPTTRPPVWISVVGRDAIYPLKCYDLATSPLLTSPLIVCDETPSVDDKKEPLPIPRSLGELYAKPASTDPGLNNGTLESLTDPGANLWWLLVCTAASMWSIWISHYVSHRKCNRDQRYHLFAILALVGLVAFWGVATWLFRGVAWRWNYSAASKAEIWVALFVALVALADIVHAAATNSRSEDRFAWPFWVPIVAGLLFFLTLLLCEIAVSPAAIMDVTRTVNLRSGVSPLVPLFFFMIGFVLLSYEQLRRVAALDASHRDVGQLGLPESTAFNELTGNVRALEFRLANPWKMQEQAGARQEKRRLVHYGPYLALSALLVIPAAYDLALRSSLDDSWHGAICALFYLAAVAMIVSHLWWLHQLWSRLRGVLLEMANLPFLAAFDRLPSNFSHLASGGLLFWNPSGYVPMLRILQQQLRSLAVETPPESPQARSPAVWQRLNEHLRDYLKTLAADFWPRQNLAQAYPTADPSASDTAQAVDHVKSQTPDYAQMEVFAAGMLFAYTMPFLVQVRRLAWAVLLASTALILAMWSYPFVPSSSLRASAWVLAILAAHRTWRIATQLNADEVVSRVVGTDPNKVTWNLDFAKTILTFLGPIAALVLYSFFGLPHEVLDWLRRLTGR